MSILNLIKILFQNIIGRTLRSAVKPYSYGGIWNPAAEALGGTASALFQLIINPTWAITYPSTLAILY